MKNILPDNKLYQISTSYLFDKFLVKDKNEEYKFKRFLSEILKIDSVLKKFKSFEYTYGHDKRLDIYYAIGIDKNTFEGYYYLYHPKYRNEEGELFTLYVTKSFKYLKSFIKNNFNKNRYVELYSLFVKQELKLSTFDSEAEMLLFSIFTNGLPKQGVKRKDKNMELLSHILLSEIFIEPFSGDLDKMKDIMKGGEFRAFKFLELNDDERIFLNIEYYYRLYSKKFLSNGISIGLLHNFIKG